MPERYQRPQPYEELDHTADAGVVVTGRSKEETLARLILAFTDLVTGGGPVEATSSRTVRVQADSLVDSAIDVLRMVLFVFDTEGSPAGSGGSPPGAGRGPEGGWSGGRPPSCAAGLC
ncbi:MAG: archease [Myxococcales bacterium]|nr:archease [Myxococcales bacterium]